jgi:ferredoxin-2, mitochondrial
MILRLARRIVTGKEVTFSWLTADSREIKVQGKVGESLLECAHRNGVELEGACDGSLACSTCHVILPEGLYDRQPDPTADEEDMLDLAFGLTPTSRLGCQIKITQEFQDQKIQLPKASVNMYVDGHKPKPH